MSIAAALAGFAASLFGDRIHSAGLREAIHRLGGAGSLREALNSADLSFAAIAVTGYGVAVLVMVAEGEVPEGDLVPRPMHRFFQGVLLTLVGTAWLLIVAGSMYTVGEKLANGSATSDPVLEAINYVPAVWTIVAMTSIAWSLRSAWAFAGWILWGAFALLVQVGRLLALPPWIVGFSPYSRVASTEKFDAASTIALVTGCCVLLLVAVYNRLSGDHVPATTEVLAVPAIKDLRPEISALRPCPHPLHPSDRRYNGNRKESS